MKTIGRSINWRISAENIQFSLLQLSSPTTRYFTWKSCYSKKKITQPSLKIALFSSPSIVLTYEDTLSILFFMTHAVIYHIMISLYHVVVNVICVMFSLSYLHEGMKIHKFHLFCAEVLFTFHLTFIYVYFSN